MRREPCLLVALVSCAFTLAPSFAAAQDWPQWRGPNRDARALGFEAPQSWPAELKQDWKLDVGIGVASPSLVADKLYVFARQDANEILHCLNAASGEEIWKDQYEAEAVRGPAASFDGPRCSPTVADGKVVTLGAQGMLSCYNAETGELVWRNQDNVGKVPRFATSSSPIVVEGLVITEFGADNDGGLVAYELESGSEKWKWTGSGATYGSPVQANIAGEEVVVSPMSDKLVAIAVADGTALLEMAYSQGRYNSATPIVSGDVLIVAGPDRGMTAFKLSKQGDQLVPEEVWENTDNSVAFNTPVLDDGKIYGLSNLNSLFCINAESGETVWNAPLAGEEQAQARGGEAQGDRPNRRRGEAQSGQSSDDQDPGRRRGRGGRRGGGRGGYGSIVGAGSVLMALVPGGQLTVFAPGDEFSEIASYKLAEAGAYAYPVPSKFGVFIKDQSSIALWTTD